jgi:hypothetical protein
MFQVRKRSLRDPEDFFFAHFEVSHAGNIGIGDAGNSSELQEAK